MFVWLIAKNQSEAGDTYNFYARKADVRFVEVTHVPVDGTLQLVRRKFENNFGELLFDLGVIHIKSETDWKQIGTLKDVMQTNISQLIANKRYGAF